MLAALPPMSSAENPYAAAAEAVPTEETEMEEEYLPASLGERLGASFIDGVILGVLSVGVYPAFSLWCATQGWGKKLPLGEAYNIFSGLMVNVLVHGYFLAEYGQTVGKRVLGIKIVTMEGRKPKLATILIRRELLMDLVSVIPGVGPIIHLLGILLIFRLERRCLHDYIAGTRVVQAQGLPKGNTRNTCSPDPLSVRMRELVLAAVIRKHLKVEPQELEAATSWTSDLGLCEEQAAEFLREAARSSPDAEGRKIREAGTYGELLDALDIPLFRMKRVPPKMRHPAPISPPAVEKPKTPEQC